MTGEVTVGTERLFLMVRLLRAGQLGAGGAQGPFCCLLSPFLRGRGEAWSERKAPSLGRRSEGWAQPLPRSRLPGRASPQPAPPLTPLALSSNLTT